MIGKALQSLPEKEKRKISAETKREIASLTHEAIQQALANKRQVITKGQTASLEYQVGPTQSRRIGKRTMEGGGGLTNASGMAPFVAVKVVNTKDEAERHP